MSPDKYESGESRDLILSQLSGSEIDRVMQLFRLIIEFIARVEGFLKAGVDITSLVRSNGYDVVEVAMKVLDVELLKFEGGHGVYLRKHAKSLLRKVQKLREFPNEAAFFDIQKGIMELNALLA